MINHPHSGFLNRKITTIYKTKFQHLLCILLFGLEHFVNKILKRNQSAYPGVGVRSANTSNSYLSKVSQYCYSL